MTTAIVTQQPGPLWDQSLEVLNERDRTTDPDKRAWLLGVNAGYVAALSPADVWQLIFTQARGSHYATPAPYEQAVTGLRMLRLPELQLRSVLYYSGVLHGYKQATVDEPDADECIMCGNRILTDRVQHAQCRYHGYFCSEDCRQKTCRPVCERNDDITWYQP